MMIEKIVIIGGGQASISCASQLRSLGFEGDICMICEESYYPYQRPPLSKKFLTGQFLEERLLLKKVDYYKINNIEVLLSKKATKSLIWAAVTFLRRVPYMHKYGMLM